MASSAGRHSGGLLICLIRPGLKPPLPPEYGAQLQPGSVSMSTAVGSVNRLAVAAICVCLPVIGLSVAAVLLFSWIRFEIEEWRRDELD